MEKTEIIAALVEVFCCIGCNRLLDPARIELKPTDSRLHERVEAQCSHCDKLLEFPLLFSTFEDPTPNCPVCAGSHDPASLHLATMRGLTWQLVSCSCCQTQYCILDDALPALSADEALDAQLQIDAHQGDLLSLFGSSSGL